MQDQAYRWLTSEGVDFIKKGQGKWFERFETLGLTAHGGDLNGAVILFGERAKLDELRRTDEFEAFAMKMGSMFDHFGVVPGVNWDGMQAVMKRQMPKG
jgi:hypothetical protein